MPVREDAALVNMSLSGDQNAFGELIDRYKNLVYGLLVNRIGDFDQAEDLAQDVFVEAYVHLGTLRQHVRFSSWLCGIARNLSNKWLERRKRESEVLGQLTPFEEETGRVLMFRDATEPETPEEGYASQELKEAIWQAVGELPERSREAILLFYFNEMSHTEIAEFLEVAPSTVLRHLQNGREKLRDRMMPFVEETIRDKALRRRFTEKVAAALPLVSSPKPEPKPKPGFPLMPWGWSLKGMLAGMGTLALIGGLIGWMISGRGGDHPPKVGFPLASPMRVRLATPEEIAALAQYLNEEEEIEMKAGEQAKVIEGVGKLGWDQWEGCTFIGALTAAMRAIGAVSAPMWSFIDFLIAETRKEGMAEQFLFYVATAAFVFFVFFLRFMTG